MKVDPAFTLILILTAPIAVGLVESNRRAGSLLVMVTTTPPAGAATLRIPLICCCKSSPMVAFPTLIGGAGVTSTVAVVSLIPGADARRVVAPTTTPVTET